MTVQNQRCFSLKEASKYLGDVLIYDHDKKAFLIEPLVISRKFVWAKEDLDAYVDAQRKEVS